MQNKVFRQLIQHDLHTGLLSNLPKYLLGAFVFCFGAIMFFSSAQAMELQGSAFDCAVFIYRGMHVYIPADNEIFPIPMLWLMLQIVIAFLIISYPTQDLYAYGIQVLTRAKSRKLWWLSKCVWNLISVLLFYFMGFIVIIIFSLLSGDPSFALNEQSNIMINEFVIQSVPYSKVFTAVFVLPVLTSCAVSLLQMVLNFILQPIYSYLVVISLLLASAYYSSPFLIGNYSMLLRNEIVYEGGVNTTIGMAVNLLIMLFCIFFGMHYLKRYDILKKV